MALRLDDITKKVGQEQHIYETQLTLADGSLNVLLGPTLAGKTSLMRLLAGLDRPSSGRLLVADRDVTGHSVRRRSVAMVYQQFINYPSFTVYDNIASPLRRAGVAKADIDRQVREVAAMLKLEPLLKRLPAALSGGQQQRTALARALVKKADLLLLDEPLVNLDYKLREELREELRQIFSQRQAVVVYATTEPLEALLLGGNTVVLDQGRVLQHGPTVEVFHNPATIRVGEIFSDPPINQIDGAIGGERQVRLGQAAQPITLPLAAAEHMRALSPGDYRFGVRANHLFVNRRGPHDIEFGAAVELAEISGSETFIHVAFGDQTSWVVQEEGVHSFKLGQRLQVFLDPRDLYAFDSAGRLVAAPTARVA